MYGGINAINFATGGVRRMLLESGGVHAYTALYAPDHQAATTAQVVNVVYTTTTCTAASGTTIGTLCVVY